MGTSLTTSAASGDVINATTLRTYVAAIEAYVNEGVESADLAASWVKSTHLFGCNFNGGANAFTRRETGHTVYRYTSHDPATRTIHHPNNNAGGYVSIEGTGTTFVVPENVQAGGSPYYRCRVKASIYAFEYGGAAIGGIDNATNVAATLAIFVDGTAIGGSLRNVYKSSRLDAGIVNVGAIYARQQHTLLGSVPASTLTAGVHSVDVRILVYQPGTAAPTQAWQHLFCSGRTARVDWYYR